MNHKKALGMALQDMKAADWFKQLDKETQDDAIQQLKDFYTPPNIMENTLLNRALITSEWPHFCKDLFPWADPTIGTVIVNMEKRAYFTRHSETLW